MNKQQLWNIWYVIGAFMMLMLFQSVWTTYRTVEAIPYSDFLKFLNEGRIVELTVDQEQITGRLKEPINGRQYFITNRVDPALAEQIAKSGATFTGTVQNTFLATLLSWVLPILIFFGIWMFVVRRFAEKQGFGGFVNVDFTVLGTAVNEAARIAALCRSLDQTLIISEAFADTCGALRARLVGLGRYALRGVGRPQMLWTLDPDAAE